MVLCKTLMKKYSSDIFAFCLIGIVIVGTVVGVHAHETKLKNNIQEIQTNIDMLVELQFETHELANKYRSVLNCGDDNPAIQNLKDSWNFLQTEKDSYSTKIADLQRRIDVFKNNYSGKFKITYYDTCYSCVGGWGKTTATGAVPVDGVTVAVDPNVIPLGSKIYIEGIGVRIAQDTGGAIKGNKIDLYVDNCKNTDMAIYNQKYLKVWVIEE